VIAMNKYATLLSMTGLLAATGCDRTAAPLSPEPSGETVAIAPRIVRASALGLPLYQGANSVLVEAVGPNGTVLQQASARFSDHGVSLQSVPGDAQVQIRVTGQTAGFQTLWTGISSPFRASDLASGVSTTTGGVANPLVEVSAAPGVTSAYLGVWNYRYASDYWYASTTWSEQSVDVVSLRQLRFLSDGTFERVYVSYDSTIGDQVVYLDAVKGTYVQFAPDSLQLTYATTVSCSDVDAHFETARISKCAGSYLDGHVDWSTGVGSTEGERFSVASTGSGLQVAANRTYSAGALPVPEVLGAWSRTFSGGGEIVRFYSNSVYESLYWELTGGIETYFSGARGYYSPIPGSDSVTLVPKVDVSCSDASCHAGTQVDWSTGTASTDSAVRIQAVRTGSSSLVLGGSYLFVPE